MFSCSRPAMFAIADRLIELSAALEHSLHARDLVGVPIADRLIDFAALEHPPMLDLRCPNRRSVG